MVRWNDETNRWWCCCSIFFHPPLKLGNLERLSISKDGKNAADAFFFYSNFISPSSLNDDGVKYGLPMDIYLRNNINTTTKQHSNSPQQFNVCFKQTKIIQTNHTKQQWDKPNLIWKEKKGLIHEPFDWKPTYWKKRVSCYTRTS